MTFTAKVHNSTIAVPPGIHLPEGTEVEVLTREAPAPPAPNPLAWARQYVGALKDLPEDFAAEHDHYIHGTQKRSS